MTMCYFTDLSRAQRTFSKTLQNFSFECIGETQTEDETHISQSLKEFGRLIASIEDERDRMVMLFVQDSIQVWFV